jgi:hypothetical protein
VNRWVKDEGYCPAVNLSTDVIRHLSKPCQAFFNELDFRIHIESTTISHGCCGRREDDRVQRRASLGQCRQILFLVIRYAIFPAAKHDADPFEGQGSCAITCLPPASPR